MSDFPAVPAVRRLFGTDGVRGVANSELSSQMALALGAAAAHILHHSVASNTARPTFVVGRDGRISGDMLFSALAAGVCSQGADVLDLGVIPTPGVAWAAQAVGASAGVVISASHNPVADNGIKFFGPNGKKLPDDVEAKIEAELTHWENLPRPTGAGVGRMVTRHDLENGYANHLARSAGGVRLNGMHLVTDCAHGAASFLARPVLEGLGAKVTLLFADPNGVNINEDCGSLHPDRLAQTVVETGAWGGMAFDGDADRVILVDEKGRIFDGDRILYTLGIWLHSQNELTNSVVVGTVMSNLGLEHALQKHDIRLVRAPVGDRYVARAMTENEAALGGEKSGHILLPHLSQAGDGMLTALQVLRVCQTSGKSLGQWADEVTELPQKLVNVRVRERDGWQTVPEIARALETAETALQGRGRIFVRPSGTEKLIRIMAEGPSETEVNALVESVAQAVRDHFA